METVVCLVQFGLPCLIVLVCMVLQMYYIKKAFGDHENPLLNTANQVNLTVFLISLLYLSSVSLYYMEIYPLVEHNSQILPEPLQVLLQLTLPLINAALFPTILILRKPEMRAQYRNYITKVLLEKFLLLPLTIYGKVRHLAQRIRGYTAEIWSELPTYSAKFVIWLKDDKGIYRNLIRTTLYIWPPSSFHIIIFVL